MPARDPAVREEISTLATHARWAQVTDRAAATAPGRTAFRARFEAEIPDSVTDPRQRQSMVNHAISAWLIRQRRAKRQAEALAVQALAGDGAADVT